MKYSLLPPFGIVKKLWKDTVPSASVKMLKAKSSPHACTVLLQAGHSKKGGKSGPRWLREDRVDWSCPSFSSSLRSKSLVCLGLPLLLFSCQIVFDSLWPHELQHARLPCPSLSPTVCSNSCPLSQWCHPTISSSVTPFSSWLQPFPASGAFHQVAVGASTSASVLPMNIQGWFPLGLTGLISLQSKGLSGVFSSTTVWKHQFFGTQLSLWSNSHIRSWLLEKP